MNFKNIIYCIVTFLISLSLGLLIAPDIINVMKLPHKFAVIFLISGIIAAISTVTVYFILDKFTKLANEQLEAQQQDQQWAWLKPAGIAARSPFPVNKTQVVIGRDINCDILLCNESISRRHAEVIRDSECWLLRDLDSANGTFVNGQRINGEVVLVDGDVVTLGDINLTFEGPSHPIMTPGSTPEPINRMNIDPEAMGLDTQEYNTIPTLPVSSDTQPWNSQPRNF
ncbi:FHA domain-containing protein [bacterium]|nr:FHA domain-containing protein [bacterium]